jgi:hypothetical protein
LASHGYALGMDGETLAMGPLSRDAAHLAAPAP